MQVRLKIKLTKDAAPTHPKEQQRKTALFTRGPFYVWRYNGTFGAASQAHRSCDGAATAKHTHTRTHADDLTAMPSDHISHHER